MTIARPSNMQRVAAELPPPQPTGAPRTLDPAGKRALEASHFGHVLQHNLLVMSCRTASLQARLEAAERVFQVWRPLCVLMGELEGCCPNASEAGYGQAATLREIAEGAGR
jgi:hypothetical protein